MVPDPGFEPGRLKTLVFETSASTNSANRAYSGAARKNRTFGLSLTKGMLCP